MSASKLGGRFRVWTSIGLMLLFVYPAAGQKAPSPEIEKLVVDLSGERTTDQAAKKILAICRRDPVARQYVANKLPELIEKTTRDDAWLNAVVLAGELKASEATPSLTKAMSLRAFPAEGHVTFSTIARLDADVVGKALFEIGEPAVPAVQKLLDSENKETRGRAVMVLRNVHSATAMAALRERLPRETDPSVKQLIEESLQYEGKPKTTIEPSQTKPEVHPD